MKLGFALFATVVLGSGADAFTSSVSRSSRVAPLRETISSELGTPCEEECALDGFPNMPASVHPGVVTGQAMIDLLDHAKEQGEFGLFNFGVGCRSGGIIVSVLNLPNLPSLVSSEEICYSRSSFISHYFLRLYLYSQDMPSLPSTASLHLELMPVLRLPARTMLLLSFSSPLVDRR